MKESDLQVDVADYLAVRYPDVLFHSDFGSGIKLTIGQAAKQKRQNGGRRAWPDLLIAKPKRREVSVMIDFTAVDMNGKKFKPEIVVANGLFLELKKDGETLYPGPRAKKRFRSIDGKEYKTEHLMEQADVLYKLRDAGYAAEFAIGFDEATTIIDEYLGKERKCGSLL